MTSIMFYSFSANSASITPCFEKVREASPEGLGRPCKPEAPSPANGKIHAKAGYNATARIPGDQILKLFQATK